MQISTSNLSKLDEETHSQLSLEEGFLGAGRRQRIRVAVGIRVRVRDAKREPESDCVRGRYGWVDEEDGRDGDDSRETRTERDEREYYYYYYYYYYDKKRIQLR